jgi:hypothetical protein
MNDKLLLSNEIGVYPNPPISGTYPVFIENTIFGFQPYMNFDGKLWDVPHEFINKRIWWLNEKWDNINELSQ